jgi:transcriptional regulator of arginine metabolism
VKRVRQQKVLEIVAAKRVATQEELAGELALRGIDATQSSVSRDIAELNLIKSNGYYTVPGPPAAPAGDIVEIDTAGDNLIVVKTDVGLAQPAALRIDRAKLDEIVGTVAGDDTILIAVKSRAAQQLALKRIMSLFANPSSTRRPNRRRSRRISSRTPERL